MPAVYCDYCDQGFEQKTAAAEHEEKEHSDGEEKLLHARIPGVAGLYHMFSWIRKRT